MLNNSSNRSLTLGKNSQAGSNRISGSNLFFKDRKTNMNDEA